MDGEAFAKGCKGVARVDEAPAVFARETVGENPFVSFVKRNIVASTDPLIVLMVAMLIYLCRLEYSMSILSKSVDG